LAEKAANLAPGVLAYQDTLAWVYRARDDLTSAQAILEKITAAAPNPDFEYHLGVVYSEQHKDDEAIAAFDRALTLAPTFRAAREAREKLAGPG
jgi:tetratricopeptide (TPR) repeat protein